MSKKGIITNIGFYSFFPVIISYLVSIIIFNIKEYKLIVKQIDEIVLAKKGIPEPKPIKRKTKKHLFQEYIIGKELENEENMDDNIYNEINIDKKIKGRNSKKIMDNFFIKADDEVIFEELFENPSTIKEQNHFGTVNNNKRNNKKINNNIINNKKSFNYSNEKNSPPLKKSDIYNNNNNIYKKSNKNLNNITRNPKLIEEPDSKNAILKDIISKKSKKEKKYLLIKERFKEILAPIDAELNDFGYKKAFLLDHRSYFRFYFSLLRTKHIFFQLFDTKDYNAISIKILLLFFNFAANYAVNALFFSDETMHQISEDGGNFNFIYQLPQIAYSTIISMLIDYATSSLSLSQDDVIDIKKHKNLKTLDEKANRIKKMIRLKTIFFFVTNFLFILLFWYYLGCFCAVYKNTQYHLIKDTLISYGIGVLTPFATFLLPGIFRIPSLKEYTQGKEKLFKLSKLIQNYL